MKWFNDAKGYGFITRHNGAADLFVHQSAVMMNGFRSLTDGEEVEFEVEQSPKGPRAANVRKLSIEGGF